MAKKVVRADDAVVSVIRRIMVKDGGELAALPAERLDRKVYERVAKFLEAAGGKWNRSRQGFVFADKSASLAVGAALNDGEVVDKKRTLEAFYTPHDLVEQLLERAGVKRGTLMLEPSAGDGRIAIAARKRGAVVTCCEIDDDRRAILRDGFEVLGGDFLKVVPPKKLFDAVVMNPPFSRGTDMRHVLHAMDFLRPGGVLVSVTAGSTPHAADSPRTAAALRFKNALSKGKTQWTELPEGTFESSGTMVRTAVLRFEK